MRSASAAALIVLGLAGCSTTMDQAARLQLDDARIRATENPLRIQGREGALAVTRVALISGHGGSAVVVTLRNRTARAVSDLPLLVAAATGHRLRPLNGDPGRDYFQTHVPAVAGGSVLRWVLTVDHRLAPGTHLVVRLGSPGVTPAIGALPVLVSSVSAAGVTVENPSAVPQYQLPVYAVAVRAGQAVAAGQTEIPLLPTGARSHIHIPLIGAARSAALTVQTPPTIFR